MGEVKVRRVGYAAGAEITGVDGTKPLDPSAVETIKCAFVDHLMVYFPDQNLDAKQLRDFSAHFGELDVSENTRILPRHPDFPEVLVRANKPVDAGGAKIRGSNPADHWHADYSFSRRGATLSFLLGKEVPSIGGDTMFANLYMAYEALSPAMQRMLESIEAVHDITLARNVPPEIHAEQLVRNPPTVHPVIRVIPESGRKALFVNDFIRNFVGWTREETLPLLDYLIEHSTRYEFIYRHRWSKNHLIVWDNRCTLHYAVQDYAAEIRLMLRASLLDPIEAPTLSRVAAPA